MKRKVANAALVALAAMSAAVPVVAQAPSLAMLDGLDRGDWEMRVRGQDGGVRRICLGDGRELIQLRHPSAACKRVVVTDRQSEVTVQYTCPGQGYGRTSIRRETARLVQIDSQGIANGLPFSFAAEARRIGACGS